MKRVELNKRAWKEVRRGWSDSPSLYVKIEYGREKVQTKIVGRTFSPDFPIKQIIVRSCVIYACPHFFFTLLTRLISGRSSSLEEMGVKFTIMHHSIKWIDTTVSQLEISLDDLRNKTVGGEGVYSLN